MVDALIETSSTQTYPERLPEPSAPAPADGVAPADIEDPEIEPVEPDAPADENSADDSN
jgi:hypothetical protein